MSEYFDIVDENDQVIGQAPRSQCHGNPDLVHRVAHVLVFNRERRLLLQKRSHLKDVQPGKWDTSVGGHLDPGEDYLQAAYREMSEELGIVGTPLTFLYHSKIRNDFESENVATYLARFDGEIRFSTEEITEVKFWTYEQIEKKLGSGTFTPNFEEEWGMFHAWNRCYPPNDELKSGFCSGDTFPDFSWNEMFD